mgnify:FL=1
MKKRFLSLLLAGAALTMALTGCGSGNKDNGGAASGSGAGASGAASSGANADSDVAYVKDKGTLIVGITDFNPMDYQESGSDEWIGFDADMAKEFAKTLGVEAEFIEIN